MFVTVEIIETLTFDKFLTVFCQRKDSSLQLGRGLIMKASSVTPSEYKYRVSGHNMMITLPGGKVRNVCCF